MRGVAALDRAKPQASGRRRQAFAVDRIVLEHQQRVEQLADPRRLLDLAKPDVLVRQQRRLPFLRLMQQLGQRQPGRQPHPQRQGVDEQPDHLLDAGKLGRPPRHRHPEHHVVAARQPAQQHAERGLDQRVQGDSLRPGASLQRSRQRGIERQHQRLRRNRRGSLLRHAPGLPRHQVGALLETCKRVLPGRKSGRPVGAREQRQIVAVRRHRGQPIGAAARAVGREPLPHQDRRRPAVHQQVVVAQQDPMPRGAKPDQHQPDERRRAQIEPLQPVGRSDPGQLLALGAVVEVRQVDQPPRHIELRQHHLHRTAQALVHEAAPQALVAVHHRLQRRCEPCGVERAIELQAQAAPYRGRAPARRTAHGTAGPPVAATAAGCPRDRDRPAPAARSRPATAQPAAGRSASARRRQPPPCAPPAQSAPGTRSPPDRAPRPRRAAPAQSSAAPKAAGPPRHRASAR